MSKELSNEWFEGFETYQKWFESVKLKSGRDEISRAMVINYNSILRKMIKFFRAGEDKGANPDSIIEWAKSVDPNEVIKTLNKFSLWLQGKEVEGYELREPSRKGKFMMQRTADKDAHGGARGFFTHNRIWLPRVGKKFAGRSPTKKNDANYAVFKLDPDNPDLVIKDYSQFRIFLSNLNFRDQTVALCMLSSSQDSGDLLDLNVGFVTGQYNRERLLWEGTRNKTGEEFRTFISKEATEFLRQYVAQEREDADEDVPIFIGRADEGLTAKNISENFRGAANRMGLVNGKTQHPYRPKRFRSIFSSACYQANIDDGARHILQGHAGTISESYREMPEANLEQIYAQVEPYLTVFAEGNKQELVETRKKSEKALDLALDLREENKRLLEMVGQLAEKMGRMEEFIEKLGYDPDLDEVKYDPDKDQQKEEG